MKLLTSKTILVVCLVIAMSNDFGTSVEISPTRLVDLDSDESDKTLNDAALDATVDRDESADLSESVLRASKPAMIGQRCENGFVKANEPTKRIYPSHDGTVKRPKIINNIYIVINGNDSTPNACKPGVCNVSVSSKPDEKGNIVSEVHLSIITSATSDIKIDDVPVIDGLRGLDKEVQPDERSIFHSINRPNPYLHRENIPQIQANYQRYGEPWYQYRRAFQKPREYREHNAGFRGYNTWPRGRLVVHDKIGPPFEQNRTTR